MNATLLFLFGTANTEQDQPHANHSTPGCANQYHLHSIHHFCWPSLMESASSKVNECPSYCFFFSPLDGLCFLTVEHMLLAYEYAAYQMSVCSTL